MELRKNKTLHFIGIGGSGMCPLAKICLKKGFKVTGSDLKENVNTIALKDFGAKIFFGHKQDNLREADIVVVSSAIPKNNVEYLAALQEKKVIKRAEMLDIIMQDYEKKIAVAGTHGKTTTTAMIIRLLDLTHRDPTYAFGAELQDYGSNAELGSSPYFATEADESDGSFLDLKPNIGILTNIEPEHMNYYKQFDNLMNHFTKFLTSILDQKGYLIINRDDKNLMQVCSNLPTEDIIYYSCDENSNIMANNISYSPNGTRFQLNINGNDEGEIHLRVFGKHNVYNSLAAISFGIKEKLPLEQIKKALFNFMGTNRRFQLISNINNIIIYDDYAHHPTEIRTTLEGIKNTFPKKRIICIFQPHRYSRTQDLIEHFSDAFDAADLTIITEIYAASEKKIDGISGKLIIDKMSSKKNSTAIFVEQKSEIANYLLPLLKNEDLIVTMGAGNINFIAKELSARLKTNLAAITKGN